MSSPEAAARQRQEVGGVSSQSLGPWRPRPSGSRQSSLDAREEQLLLERLRAGDEEAFSELVDRYHPSMIRLALTRVRSRAVAEEVAQDAWVGVLRGLDTFEGRSSLRSWLFRIVINRAISSGVRERAHLPVHGDELEHRDGRFSQDGWWVTPPTHWADEVVDRLTAPSLVERVHEVITELPERQAQVVTLRDVEGLSSAEVCTILGISEGNQRVLLHRARTRIRAALEQEVMP
ncbi:MAG TPA: RNA polymerase sigma factor [Nocardioides sp.]|uniref:RNA polymerase sigma factor n=1 Tax=Nocardioides sp. TaxID=35761 RepID=UPI002E36D931|nr:RNA polymerase sigma factor [Nocardioides sp.]HEX5088355.1 RNA polymerase sigma factor [Nocardioides sp.]